MLSIALVPGLTVVTGKKADGISADITLGQGVHHDTMTGVNMLIFWQCLVHFA